MEKTEMSLRNKIITILLGMCIVLVRVVMPSVFHVTKGMVILEAALELAICAGAFLINRKSLPYFFRARYGKDGKPDVGKFLLRALIVTVIAIILNIVIQFAVQILWAEFTGTGIPTSPAESVASQFVEVFIPAVVIATCIAAPIAEEFVFRLTMKEIFPNRLLFVVVSSLLFGFIHTASISPAMLPYVGVGVMFSVIYLITGDIRLNMIAHIVNNSFLIIYGIIAGMSAGA